MEGVFNGTKKVGVSESVVDAEDLAVTEAAVVLIERVVVVGASERMEEGVVLTGIAVEEEVLTETAVVEEVLTEIVVDVEDSIETGEVADEAVAEVSEGAMTISDIVLAEGITIGKGEVGLVTENLLENHSKLTRKLYLTIRRK